MEKIKELMSLKRASVLFLVLPFLVIFLLKIEDIDYLLSAKIFILIALILFFDYIYFATFQIFGSKAMLFIIIQSSLIVFFYYSYFLNFIIFINEHTINIHLRAKYILPEIFVFIILIQYKLRNKLKEMLHISNSFFFILSFIILSNNVYGKIKNKNNYLISHPINIINEIKKPTILIIADEYVSPKELNKVYKADSVFNFEKKLAAKKWIIKDKIFSYNTLTINSLSSIFNFNYKVDDSGINIDLAKEKLKKSVLYDSLKNKGVSFYNFGIFDIGETNAKSKIYFYENKIIEKKFILYFFSSTLLKPILRPNFYKTKQIIHNRLNIEDSTGELNKINSNNAFIYIHLLLPHEPFEYHGKLNFNLDTKTTDHLTKYYNYWNFTNRLLDTFLADLIKENKYKIILTGDHGFRGDNRINPHYTFTAFYGFGQPAIDRMKSVQDLGSLIKGDF